jgi:hypothetical protein
MFHRGERGCAYVHEDGFPRSVMVLTGLLDWPPRRLVFDVSMRGDSAAPYRYVGGRPAGVLAVLRRRCDGVRCLLTPEGVVEVSG